MTLSSSRTGAHPEVPSGSVLAVMDFYLPGRLAGGPVTTLANMTAALSDELPFLIVTRNQDINGSVYAQMPTCTPVRINAAHVIYLKPSELKSSEILTLCERFQVRALYLNSFFSPTVIGLLLALRKNRQDLRVVLAPRGEFSPGALALKRWKKLSYLLLFRVLRLKRLIDVYQASSALEERDILRVLGPVHVRVAPDMPDPTRIAVANHKSPDGRLRLAFVSRISPKKNLEYALALLAEQTVDTEFDIYGPLEDEGYWALCQQRIRTLPANVRVNYCGILDHALVRQTFGNYDAFLFPTWGENYGHVVIEALSAGCPVILSDRTPWQDLETRGVGWVCKLEQPEEFTYALRVLSQDTPAELKARRERCAEYAQEVVSDPQVRAQNLRLFTE